MDDGIRWTHTGRGGRGVTSATVLRCGRTATFERATPTSLSVTHRHVPFVVGFVAVDARKVGRLQIWATGINGIPVEGTQISMRGDTLEVELQRLKMFVQCTLCGMTTGGDEQITSDGVGIIFGQSSGFFSIDGLC
jgi:hypothetical protein